MLYYSRSMPNKPSYYERANFLKRRRRRPTPPWLAWTGIDSMQTVPASERGKSALLVTGDPSRNKELCVPGGGFATIKIELAKAWDSLMAERGYKPLAAFMLTSDLKPDAPTPRQRRRPTLTGARGDRPYGPRPQWGERPRSPQWDGERPRSPQRWREQRRMRP